LTSRCWTDLDFNQSRLCAPALTPQRRFPPPSSVDEPDMKLGQPCFIVRDANGQALAYVYFEGSKTVARRRTSSPEGNRPLLHRPGRRSALAQIVVALW